MTTADPHDLRRFLSAQAPAFDAALAQLRAGRKRTHWMWFVFPQLRGLGTSSMADRYGIESLAEAVAYAAHPVLGARLLLCTQAVLDNAGVPLTALFGAPDDAKFRSSMTLFRRATGGNLYRAALELTCGGVEDGRTIALLER